MDDTASALFRDPAASPAARVADLLSRLTLAEKVALLHQHQAPVPRLGMAGFRTGTEALHGVAWLGPATAFPQAVGLGATWDPELVRQVGAAVGDEVRGFHHKDPDRIGLNVWAPVVNPLRDPRWGRNEEGYAEDSWLTGLLGTAYAAGLCGDHAVYLRTAPTLKHFLGYNNETDRHLTSSDLPPRVLHEYELPAFRAPIAEGAAVAVMASYNLVNGRPAHLSPLLASHLRNWSTEHVLVVGDAYACTNIAGDQGYHADHAAGFGAALRAGIDCFTENDADSAPTIARITEALERGLVADADVDSAVTHILSVRLRLGEFDPPEGNPYAAISFDVVNCAAHQRLARETARRAVILLQNHPLAQDGGLALDGGSSRDGGPPQDGELSRDTAPLLPLRPQQTVAVIGPLADTVLTDWYSGTLPYAVTPRAGLAARLGPDAVRFAEGVDRVKLSTVAGIVTAADAPDGGPLRVSPAGDGGGDGPRYGHFDVLDWGAGTTTLRAVANGRYVRADEDGLLVNDRPGPGEWVVRETFEAVPRADGVVLRAVAADRWVTVDGDGLLRADAPDAEAATAFTVDLVEDGIAAAAQTAREADVTVVVLGNHPMVGGRETEDRPHLDLPPAQEALLRAVHAANPRTALLLVSSYPYAVRWAREHLPAVLWSAHGGQEHGNALADVLLGTTDSGELVEPTGRLPQTWYADTAELPDLLDYDIIGSDATYQYFRGTPLYPFGHGLGYTRFAYRDLRCDTATVDADGQVGISVEVTNVGDRPGEDVVQLYTRQRRSRVKQPLRQLRGFRRVRLAPGETATVTMPLRAADLAHFDVTTGRLLVEDAPHTVYVGRSCTDLVAATTLRVRGETVSSPDPARVALRAANRDQEYATTLTDEGPERGDAVAAVHDGAWLGFHGVTIGGGLESATVHAGAPGDGATVELRLDDPFAGPVVARFEIPGGAGRHEWTPVRAPLTLGATGGNRDLYLVLPTAGTRISSLAFDAGVDGPPGEGADA